MFEAPAGNTHDADLQPPTKQQGKKPAKGGKPKSAAGVAGRKDASGQESKIEISELKKRAKELESLYKKKQDASEAHTLGVKAVAEASGLMANVVGKYIKAASDAKFLAKKREYEQLALVFDEMKG